MHISPVDITDSNSVSNSQFLTTDELDLCPRQFTEPWLWTLTECRNGQLNVNIETSA